MAKDKDVDKFARELQKQIILKESTMRECNSEKNMEKCNCSYEPCSRKGICCECIQYHWSMKELPACFFPDDVERTFDRSIRRFIEVYKDRG